MSTLYCWRAASITSGGVKPLKTAQRFSGAGNKWMMQHEPIQVLACLAGDTRLEDVVTVSLMCQFGWEQARGG
eukprot:7126895-Pyramimonas_sp.AAC.2